MKKINNNQAREFVENRKEFTANNLSAKQIGDAYVVLSYGYYPIFVYADGEWYENKAKFSNTTAKQMSKSRPDANVINKVSTDELKSLVMKHGKGGMYAKGGKIKPKEWVVNFHNDDDESYETTYVMATSKNDAIEKGWRELSENGHDSDDFSVESVYQLKKNKMAKGGKTLMKGGNAPYITAENDEGQQETVYLSGGEDGNDIESDLIDALEGDFTIVEISDDLDYFLEKGNVGYIYDADAVTAICKAIEISQDMGIPFEILARVYSDWKPSDFGDFFDENYEGNYISDKALAQNYVDSIGGLSELATNTLTQYFDMERFAKDLSMDYSEYSGYYFRNS